MDISTQLLIVDDEKLIRWSLSQHFSKKRYIVIEAKNGEEAWEKIQLNTPDVILLDLKMPILDGMGLLERLNENHISIPTIILTAHGEIPTAVRAMKIGAKEFLQKPFELKQVEFSVERVLNHQNLVNERDYLRGKIAKPYGKLIGESPKWTDFVRKLKRIENTAVPMILLTGETGTGKGLVARTIHEQGGRSNHPFMDIDCTSLPKSLVQSELFGHERGAFTDARSTKKGLFEMARQGTIFLDEIGELDLSTQSNLLYSLEERRFKRVGGTSNLPLRAVIIAATNRDLAKEVELGSFRQDLYYRLNLIHLHIPPLRERVDDIKLITEVFLKRFAKQYRRPLSKISHQVINQLENYSWPGNIRELRNVIERIVLLDAPNIIELQHLPTELCKPLKKSNHSIPFELPEEGISLEQVERSFLEQAMEISGGNQSKASRLLQISRFTLRYRLQKFGL
jgi:two-component system, NtrC family, response regulator AtoC